MGWNLTKSDDAGTRQRVITKLGSETGLAIIKTITDIMGANQKDETTVSRFKDRTLPFYRIISYPDVLSSLILETSVDTIYTFLFGPSGRRGLSVFRFTATALSIMILGHSSSDEEVSTIAISSSLAVLSRLIEHCTTISKSFLMPSTGVVWLLILSLRRYDEISLGGVFHRSCTVFC